MKAQVMEAAVERLLTELEPGSGRIDIFSGQASGDGVDFWVEPIIGPGERIIYRAEIQGHSRGFSVENCDRVKAAISALRGFLGEYRTIEIEEVRH